MVTEKKNNWRGYKKQVGWWCFSTTGKVGDATNKEINESMLNALEKVCDVIKDFFILTKLEITIAPEETLYLQNDNGFMASEIKQIIINEINRLNSKGKDVFVIRIYSTTAKIALFLKLCNLTIIYSINKNLTLLAHITIQKFKKDLFVKL